MGTRVFPGPMHRVGRVPGGKVHVYLDDAAYRYGNLHIYCVNGPFWPVVGQSPGSPIPHTYFVIRNNNNFYVFSFWITEKTVFYPRYRTCTRAGYLHCLAYPYVRYYSQWPTCFFPHRILIIDGQVIRGAGMHIIRIFKTAHTKANIIITVGSVVVFVAGFGRGIRRHFSDTLVLHYEIANREPKSREIASLCGTLENLQ